jgi:hypothetical protein
LLRSKKETCSWSAVMFAGSNFATACPPCKDKNESFASESGSSHGYICIYTGRNKSLTAGTLRTYS